MVCLDADDFQPFVMTGKPSKSSTDFFNGTEYAST